MVLEGVLLGGERGGGAAEGLRGCGCARARVRAGPGAVAFVWPPVVTRGWRCGARGAVSAVGVPRLVVPRPVPVPAGVARPVVVAASFVRTIAVAAASVGRSGALVPPIERAVVGRVAPLRAMVARPIRRCGPPVDIWGGSPPWGMDISVILARTS